MGKRAFKLRSMANRRPGAGPLLSEKKRSTEMLCSKLIVMLKLSLKFSAPESVVPAKAGTQ